MLTNADVIAALERSYVAKDLSATFLSAGIAQAQDSILIDDDTFHDTAAVNTGGGPANTPIVAIGGLKNTYNLFASGQNVDEFARNLSGNIPATTVFVLGELVFDVTFFLPPTFNNTTVNVDAQALGLAGQILLQSSKINIKVNSRDRFSKTLTKWVSYRFPAYLNQILGQVAPTPVPLAISTREQVYPLSKQFMNPITFPTSNPIGSTLETDVNKYITAVYGANIPTAVSNALAIPLAMVVDMDFTGATVKPV